MKYGNSGYEKNVTRNQLFLLTRNPLFLVSRNCVLKNASHKVALARCDDDRGAAGKN